MQVVVRLHYHNIFFVKRLLASQIPNNGVSFVIRQRWEVIITWKWPQLFTNDLWFGQRAALFSQSLFLMVPRMSSKCACHFQPVSSSFGFVFALRNSYLALLRSYPTTSSFAMAPPLPATAPQNKHAARASTLSTPCFCDKSFRWKSNDNTKSSGISSDEENASNWPWTPPAVHRPVSVSYEGISGSLVSLLSSTVYSDKVSNSLVFVSFRNC